MIGCDKIVEEHVRNHTLTLETRQDTLDVMQFQLEYRDTPKAIFLTSQNLIAWDSVLEQIP